jgi:predicted nucleotidyltransferase
MDAKITSLVKILLQEEADVYLVILFGSFAANTQHDESDIDLAIATSRPLSASRLFDLKLTLQAGCDRDVDLVDLNNSGVSIILKNDIITKGKLLYAVDKVAFSQIEAPIRREAEDFLYRRRDLELQLQKRLMAHATAR